MAAEPSQPEYEVREERDIGATMPDGVRLSVDIYRPDDEGEFPVLLTMTPYGKLNERVDVTPKTYQTGWAEYAMVEGGDSEFFVNRGYAHAIADVRGCGLSEGTYKHLISDQEAEDGYQLVEWLAEQPWCDGNVGMIGISYLAFIQYMVAAKQPPHLETIVPHDGWGDTYRDIMYHGGIQGVFFRLDRNIDFSDMDPVSLDLYDEHELETRIEELLNDDSTNINKNPKLRSALSNPKIRPFWFDLLINREDNDFYQERSPAARMGRIEVPTYLGSEMHDYPVGMHLPGAAHWGWENIESETKLAFRHAVPKRPFKDDYHDDLLRWYDHHLKGKDTGIMDEPRVKIWVRGADEYVYSDEWPLEDEVEWREYYLRFEDRLEQNPAPSSDEPAVIDYEARVPQAISSGAPIQPEPDHLTYTTAPFEKSTTVIGPIALNVFVALSASDGHFIVVLQDVAPDGSIKTLSRGWLKASHRKVDADRSTPWRPYHPHTDPTPVTPGEINEYAIEIQPISNEFKAGHRLGIEIWPTDYPTGEDYDPTLMWGNNHHIPYGEDVRYKIYQDSTYPSHLLLPFVERGVDGFQNEADLT